MGSPIESIEQVTRESLLRTTGPFATLWCMPLEGTVRVQAPPNAVNRRALLFFPHGRAWPRGGVRIPLEAKQLTRDKRRAFKRMLPVLIARARDVQPAGAAGSDGDGQT